jgi:hypothetical protein
MFEFQYLFAPFFQFLTTGVLYLGPETVMPLASIIAAVLAPSASSDKENL